MGAARSPRAPSPTLTELAARIKSAAAAQRGNATGAAPTGLANRAARSYGRARRVPTCRLGMLSSARRFG